MTEPFIVGLTGSIGMGKSTTAEMFRDEGIDVWDADAAVHRLYAADGQGVEPVARLNSDVIVDRTVSRARLKDWIAADDTALSRIESVIHPLVAQDRAAFLDDATSDIVVLDIPLLFETGNSDAFDLIAVVSVPEDTQRRRVLGRSGMTQPQFERIRANQMSDAEKRARADIVIPTLNHEDTRATVRALIDDIRQGKYARDRT